MTLVVLCCTQAGASPEVISTIGDIDVKEFAAYASEYDWSQIDQILQDQISQETFPGCVAAIGNKDGLLYYKAHGTYTYGNKPEPLSGNLKVGNYTMWDMASLTKVTMTTSAVMTFYQRGELDLDWYVVDLLGPSFDNNGKSAIKVINLLLHNAGYPPDPTPYWYYLPEFGCPASKEFFYREGFTCQELVHSAVMNQTLINPVGQVFLYSDLSFITMMYVVGKLARTLGYVSVNELDDACLGARELSGLPVSDAIDQCYYLAYVEKYVIDYALMLNSTFRVSPLSSNKCAPTTNGSDFRHRTMQGHVEDPNAFAMGGVAGHAGFFSTGMDVHRLLKGLLFASPNSSWINSTTVNTFTTIYNVTQSSRAFGWDTNNYAVRDYSGCGNFSQNTFMHTGYTGTQVCNDKDRDLYAILLTNRVYPVVTDNSEAQITNARFLFSNAVISIYDGTTRKQNAFDV